MKLKYYFSVLFCILLTSIAYSGSVDTVQVYSPSMQKNIPVVIILPDNYDGSKQFPVVYLLHGYSGNYAQWINHAPQIQEEADLYQVIIVCPDGGYNSWYLNSPVDSSYKYETFIAEELVQYIDTTFKTYDTREFRAISGLSMGGHGALYISIRNREIFGAAGSIAGGVDIRPFTTRWEMTKVFGDTACCFNNWNEHTVINVIKSLQPGELALTIDCGYSDFFFQVNRNLHQQLTEAGILHDYAERPGAHNREYWKNSISYHLLFFRKFFDKNLIQEEPLSSLIK